jgi:hypothetical protein
MHTTRDFIAHTMHLFAWHDHAAVCLNFWRRRHHTRRVRMPTYLRTAQITDTQQTEEVPGSNREQFHLGEQ